MSMQVDSTRPTETIRAELSAHLDVVRQGLLDGYYVTDDLSLISKSNACFWLRRLVSPILNLFGIDTLAPYRVHNIATRLLEDCKAGKEILTNELIEGKVIKIIQMLNEKTNEKYGPQLGPIFAEFNALLVPITPTVPEPSLSSSETLEVTLEEPPTAAPWHGHALSTATAVNTVVAPVIVQEIKIPEITPPAVSTSTAKPEVVTQDITVTHAINNFGYLLHDVLAENRSSFCFSPSAALEMMTLLLKGMKDPKPLAQFLQLQELDTPLLDNDLTARRNMLTKQHGHEVMVIAARDLSENEFPKPFLEKAKASHNVQTVFYDEKASLRERVNSCLQTETKDQIEQLFGREFSKGNPAKLLQFAFINALLLKAKLKTGLLADIVTKKPFTFSDKKTSVNLLHFPKASVRMRRGDDFTMIEIPYESEDETFPLSKVIFLPSDVEQFAEFSKKLTPSLVTECRKDAKEEQVELFMPQATTQSSNFNILEVVESFTPKIEGTTSPFTGLMQEVRFVEEARHSDIAVPTSTSTNDAPPEKVSIDRSFYYFVMSGDTMLLQGQVDDASGFTKGNAHSKNWPW